MIIGLTGPMASGKSTIVDALKNEGFKYFALSDIIREECVKQGKEITRDNMMAIGQKLREEFDAGVLGMRALQKILAEGENDNWIIDGIRNPAEAKELKKYSNFILVANTAPEDIIISRVLSRKRSDDTLDEAAIRLKLRREMGEGEPHEGQQVQKCIDMADYVFENTMPIEQVETEFMKLYTKINDEQKT